MQPPPPPPPTRPRVPASSASNVDQLVYQGHRKLVHMWQNESSEVDSWKATFSPQGGRGAAPTTEQFYLVHKFTV
jgi:hypothetical protein